MKTQRIVFYTLFFAVVILISACAPHQMYRDDAKICVSNTPVKSCTHSALQEFKNPANPDQDHLMGFIEFDDQGQLWDRKQMQAVLDDINQEAGKNDLLIITFVHGWKHGAEAGDRNIETFRSTLKQLAELENKFSRTIGQKPRKVVGVYLGWRGNSVTVPLLNELTFWDRKNTAHKVGYGGVTEVLSRLELVKKTKDIISINDAIADEMAKPNPNLDRANQVKSRTRLVVIGHSFGGAVVFSALSQILEERFIDTHGPLGQLTNARGFGDLVVLINPAFEAARFSTLSDMAAERGSYFSSQLPVLVVLTSEADDATKYAFPIGRWFATLFEYEHDIKRYNAVTRKVEVIDQGKANITAIGHFEPYRTHFLKATSDIDRESIAAPTVEEDVKRLFSITKSWQQDKPGSTIQFFGSELERTKSSAGRNPYLIVRVDKKLIHDHNDIDDPRIIAFLRQIILLASQGDNTEEQLKSIKKAFKIEQIVGVIVTEINMILLFGISIRVKSLDKYSCSLN